MQALLLRLCWNTLRWQRPSGPPKDDGYPNEHGFGHDEWNFNLDDAIEGYVYGHHPYKPAASVLTKARNRFEIGFWTKHPISREKQLVGFYRRASFAEADELARADEVIRATGIFRRRIRELKAVHPRGVKPADEIAFDANSRCYRCMVKDVEVLATPIPLPDQIFERTLPKRLKNPFFLGKMPSVKEFEAMAREATSTRRAQTDLSIDPYSRMTPAERKWIRRYQNELAKAFRDWLARNKFTSVRFETNRVDVEFRKGTKLFKAELKCCKWLGTRKAIRESIGQLLEYNCYSGRSMAARWYIVLDVAPNTLDKVFVGEITDRYSLPLLLAWRVGNDFEMFRPGQERTFEC